MSREPAYTRLDVDERRRRLLDAGSRLFAEHAYVEIVTHLCPGSPPRPSLHAALQGWLGFVDAVLLDWRTDPQLTREQIRDLLIHAFGAAIGAAQQIDPELRLT